jgi:hypothetical protein
MTVAPANTSSIIVAVTGVLQDPSTYSVSGTTLTFSAAPPSGTSNISVRYLGIPASGVTTTAYRTVTNTTATAGQTSFTIPSYTVGYVDVYRNGVYLPTSDYTATTGTTVVLTNAATVGDTITTISFYVSSVLNAIPATAGSVSTSYLVDGSVTQAKLGTGVAGNGPSFAAYQSSAQTLSSTTFTKINFQTEEWDTANCFDSVTNMRFTPNVAGYYQVTAGVATAASATGVILKLYKNGSSYKILYYNGYGSYANSNGGYGAAMAYCNGSTDYLEIYAYFVTGQAITASSDATFFQAAMVRSA